METVSNIATSQDDGAGEKLMDEKNGHKSKEIEVKYMTPTSQNGDANINIDNLKSAFAGMGKEELMKFANDPFWVRTRWFLFILFWLLWIAMLAGAIAIIVLAPKCAPPTPREWWEQSPLYKANVATFGKDSTKLQGDLKAFTTKLEYLSSLGVKTIVLSNIVKVSDVNSDGIDEFKNIAPAYGTIDDLKALISAAKEKGLKLLLTLVPNHSSLNNPYFNKSASKDPQFSSYYVWAPAKGRDLDQNPIPPNNWLSKNGGSAWEWNEKREAFYLHQFSKSEPEFNFHNPDVVTYFNEVMQFWLDVGFSGFYLERTPFLIEDRDLRNDTQKSITHIGNATHTDYEFYDHIHTENVPELTTLLRGWTTFVSNHSGILIVDSAMVAANRSFAHLVVKPQTLEKYPIFSADDLANLINTTRASNPWPVWQIKVNEEPEGSALSQGMLLTSMLLPGLPVIVAGQELGLTDLQSIPWDNTTETVGKDVISQQRSDHSFYSAYKELVKARESPSILYGSLDLHVFNGSSVFAYTRIKSGNPGYLVVFNMGSEETIVNARQLESVPNELTLLLTSDASPMADKNKVESEAVSLPGRAVAVFSFVPKAKE